jgi:hypothetical protein
MWVLLTRISIHLSLIQLFDSLAMSFHFLEIIYSELFVHPLSKRKRNDEALVACLSIYLPLCERELIHVTW